MQNLLSIKTQAHGVSQEESNHNRLKVNYNNKIMDDAVSFAVAEWLKKARKQSGLKQEELAEKAGISKSYVGHLENARPHNITGVRPSPSPDIIEALAVAMNTDVDKALLIAGFAPKNSGSLEENSTLSAIAFYYKGIPPVKRTKADLLIEMLLEEVKKAKENNEKDDVK
jgi:transcriptional regulator with XRE-family HTH domain